MLGGDATLHHIALTFLLHHGGLCVFPCRSGHCYFRQSCRIRLQWNVKKNIVLMYSCVCDDGCIGISDATYGNAVIPFFEIQGEMSVCVGQRTCLD